MTALLRGAAGCARTCWLRYGLPARFGGGGPGSESWWTYSVSIEPAGSYESALNRQWRRWARQKTSGHSRSARAAGPAASMSDPKGLRLQHPHRRSLRDSGHECAFWKSARRKIDEKGVGNLMNLLP
jgi:hypothetical protein